VDAYSVHHLRELLQQRPVSSGHAGDGVAASYFSPTVVDHDGSGAQQQRSGVDKTTVVVTKVEPAYQVTITGAGEVCGWRFAGGTQEVTGDLQRASADLCEGASGQLGGPVVAHTQMMAISPSSGINLNAALPNAVADPASITHGLEGRWGHELLREVRRRRLARRPPGKDFTTGTTARRFLLDIDKLGLNLVRRSTALQCLHDPIQLETHRRRPGEMFRHGDLTENVELFFSEIVSELENRDADEGFSTCFRA
jgi:hypothetical protein